MPQDAYMQGNRTQIYKYLIVRRDALSYRGVDLCNNHISLPRLRSVSRHRVPNIDKSRFLWALILFFAAYYLPRTLFTYLRACIRAVRFLCIRIATMIQPRYRKIHCTCSTIGGICHVKAVCHKYARGDWGIVEYVGHRVECSSLYLREGTDSVFDLLQLVLVKWMMPMDPNSWMFH